MNKAMLDAPMYDADNHISDYIPSLTCPPTDP